MSNNFEQKLKGLEGKLSLMAGAARSAVEFALKSLVDRDNDLAQQAQGAEAILEQWEIEIDDLAVGLLAEAPLACDLRLITVAMKISHELERVGDEATLISRRTLEINQEPPLRDHEDLSDMAQQGMEMLQKSIDAFLKRDSGLARAVIPLEKNVSALNQQLHRELAGFMIEKPAHINCCLNLMTIAKCLERIADHATNIAEEVVFFHEGRDFQRQEPIHG